MNSKTKSSYFLLGLITSSIKERDLLFNNEGVVNLYMRYFKYDPHGS